MRSKVFSLIITFWSILGYSLGVSSHVNCNYLSKIQTLIDNSSTGDTIFIEPGYYYENIIIKNKADLFITVVGEGEVVIDGSRIMKSGRKSVEKSRYNYKIHEYLIPKQSFDKKYPYIYNDNDEPLWVYTDLNDLRNHSTSSNDLHGLVIENERILIEHSKSNKYNISSSKPVFSIINSSNIIVDGKSQLIIKNGSRRTLSIIGDRVRNDSKIEIRNCTVINGKIGITIANTGGKVKIESCNIFSKARTDKLSWSEIKNCVDESGSPCIAQWQSNAILVSGKNNDVEIINNKIHNHFNGIVLLSNNTIVHKNEIFKIKDDAIEVESNAEEVKIYDNKVYESYVCLSLCPVKIGPIFIYNNIFSQPDKNWKISPGKKKNEFKQGKGRALKFWSQPKIGTIIKSRNIYLFNNTFYSKDNPFSIGGDKLSMSPQSSYIFNNLFLYKGVQRDNYMMHNSIEFRQNIFLHIGECANLVKDKNQNLWIGVEDKKDFDPLAFKYFQLSPLTTKALKKKKLLNRISCSAINDILVNIPGVQTITK